MAAIAMGSSPASSSAWIGNNNNNNNNNNRKMNRMKSSYITASISTGADHYDTLRIHPGASESDVKKAFRRLALQYHPDVCRGDNCTVKFQQINEAYDIVLSTLRGETKKKEKEEYYNNKEDEEFRGMNEESEWDLWEEWMGWEGAGIRDYSSHVNPYI